MQIIKWYANTISSGCVTFLSASIKLWLNWRRGIQPGHKLVLEIVSWLQAELWKSIYSFKNGTPRHYSKSKCEIWRAVPVILACCVFVFQMIGPYLIVLGQHQQRMFCCHFMRKSFTFRLWKYLAREAASECSSKTFRWENAFVTSLDPISHESNPWEVSNFQRFYVECTAQ